ncbi:FAD-dependent oxidoreductase [Limosilactobacillus kribbianus]|uniref:FAD-dependent oxidoreductase n=1 Tax=Limosilactobacillus kribbianus TaxID=2982695 RepID=UPI0022652E95|nr:FAD-dependent oxidoreductase [Limosilactobacillus kribbianus]
MEQKQYDLVIVGAGLSGLSAAVEAGSHHLKTLVLEKGRTIGGNGNYVEGALGIDSYLQKQHGIKIDKLAVLKSELDYSHYEANAAHLKHYFDHSGETIDWLHRLGVEFAGVGAQGDSWPTIHAFTGGGHAAVQVLEQKARDLGVEFLTSIAAQRILSTDSQVQGLVAKNETTGLEQTFLTKHVLLATGGYADNPQLMKQLVNSSRLMTVSDGKSTGDGLKLAWQAGGQHASLGAPQFGGGFIYDPMKPAFMYMGSELGAAATQEAILWVNEQGERFINEDVNDNMCNAGNAILTQSKVYSIFDQAAVDHLEKVGLYKKVGNSPVSPDKLAKLPEEIKADLASHQRFLTSAATIDELAAKLHLAKLPQTIQNYNQLVAAGIDTDYGKDAKYLTSVTDGPFYAVELGVGIAAAIGGIRVDNCNRVLNDYGYPIGGLYVIGNDAAGMMVGDTYAVTLPGSTAGYASFSGRNAVQHIVEE